MADNRDDMSTPPLPRNVKALGLVSLLNDASSEMIFPLLPTFVTQTLGAAPMALGVIDGAAEAVSAAMKVLAGRLSDRAARRKPLVLVGYGLASLARPLVALATGTGQVLGLRVVDRIGKGIRSGPRDALIAEATPLDQRGRAFGFHRAMDHAGALIGPLLASAVLLVRQDLRLVFGLAAVPAAVALVTLVARVRETEPAGREAPVERAPAAESAMSRPLRRYLFVLAVFTLGNSSDTFLLLRAQEAGLALALVPLLWSFHHLVKSALSTAAGGLSDRIGRREAILIGWSVYALSYAGFAAARVPWHFWLLFGVYALFHAFAEGPERALLADLGGGARRGRDFGWFHAVSGAMQLPASLLTGWLWQAFGPSVALGAGAALAAAAAVGLLLLVPAHA
jgi:MFS family permease